MFPLEAIVLRKTRIDEQRFALTCFSSEYGKIDTFYREWRWQIKLDTLSYFVGQIRTKEKNTLSSIYKTFSFGPVQKYEIYDLAGWLVSVLYTLLPLGLPYPKLFQLLKSLILTNTIKQDEILLFLIQTCRDFGITRCDIREYIQILEHNQGQSQARQDIESWIEAYKSS